jgi:anhydro-N-acetylmuramic acid kinase
VVLAKNTKTAMANTPPAQYYIGLMSGTSLDGVDGVIVDKQCRKIIGQIYQPYNNQLKQDLRQLTQSSQTSLSNLANIDIKVANAFANAVLALLNKSAISSDQIIAIGSHGQTIFHQGGRYSMQIAHGALIAEQTNITTVADFRMQDIAAGGQGAPLTPMYHQHLLKNKSGVVINLGGIANITQVANDSIFGFDTGPANTLLDNWIFKCKSLDYDNNGLWSRKGGVDKNLLKKLLSDDYFQQQAPKSTGTEYFNLEWLSNFLTGKETQKDVQRTLLELTAISISAHIKNGVDVYLCGGGVHNLFLLERLTYLNPNSNILTTKKLGVNADYVEAAAFAYFAKRTLTGLPSNLTSVTNAKSERVLGAIYQI